MVTGTATICVFDLQALKHRVADSADWWSDEEEELKEVNAANALFVALGSDGRYDVEVCTDDRFEEPLRVVTACLTCPSGRVFIGPGEDVSGGDFEPDRRQTTGQLLTVAPGRYRVTLYRLGGWVVGVFLEPTNLASGNAFDSGLSIAD